MKLMNLIRKNKLHPVDGPGHQNRHHHNNITSLRKQGGKQKMQLWFYKGLFIAKDIAGDGYNIYQGKQVLDEGYASL